MDLPGFIGPIGYRDLWHPVVELVNAIACHRCLCTFIVRIPGG
jgi:hypothetical protein